MAVEQDAICTLGEINLLPSEEEKNSNVYYIEALGADSTWGDPEQTITEITSQLIEGTTLGISPSGNRDITLKVQIIGANSAALAIGERALIETCSQDGLLPLRFLNPDQTAAVTVFDAIYTHVVANFADLDDERLTGGTRREYTLTLTCKPWPRSEYALESAPEVEAGHEPKPLPPDVLVSDGSEVDQWRTQDDSAWGPDSEPHDGMDNVWLPPDGQAVWAGRDERVKLWWPHHVSTKGTPWLVIRGYTRSTSNYRHDEQLIFQVDDVQVSPDRLSHDRDKGSFRAYVWVGDSGVPTFGITSVSKVSNGRTVLAIDSVYATAGVPSSDTGKIQARTIDVQASKPVESSVEVRGYNTSGLLASLGHWTFIYTARADGSEFNPSLASWRSASGPIRTSGEVPLSGSYSQLEFTASGSDTYLVPIDLFSPGTYQIGALLADANAEGGKHEIHWDCQTRFDSQTYTTTSGVANPTLPSWVESSGQPLWKYCPLGDVTLPLDEFVNPEDTVYQRFRIWAPQDPDVGRVRFDTLLLFNMSTGSLTVVDTSPLGDHDCVGVRLDAPTSDRPEPTVWVDMKPPATSSHALYTMAAGTRAKSRGVHRFDPGGTFLWTATSENKQAGVTVTYYPRWHTYASYVTTLPYPSITTPTDGDVLSSLDAIEGTGEPGYTITLTLNGALYGTTTVDEDGNWSIDMRPLPDGDHLIAAYQSNEMGQASDPATVAFTIDTTPPDQPVITTPADGTLTNETRPTFAGTARGAVSITLTATGTALAETFEVSADEEIVLGTADVATNGTWSLTPTTPFTEGNFTVTAVSTDRVGYTSPTSAPVTVTIDLTPPDPPTITSPVGTDATNDTTPIIRGTGEPGLRADVTLNSQRYTTTVRDDETWAVNTAIPLSPIYQHEITATQTDVAGNISTSVEATFTIDTSRPDAPIITSVTAFRITGGTSEYEDFVTLTVDGIRLDTGDSIKGDILHDGYYQWEYAFETPLADGEHTVTATETDPAGNESEPTTWTGSTTVPDTTPPDPPIIDTIDGQSTETGKVATDDTTPSIAGTAEPETTVTIYIDNTTIGTTEADTDGAWTHTPETALVDHAVHTINATATDTAGNTSQKSTPTSVLVVTETTVATWDFETDLGGWEPYGNGALSLHGPGHDSAQAMGVSTSTAESYSASCGIVSYLAPGLPYRISFWAYQPDSVTTPTKLALIGNGIEFETGTATGTATSTWEQLTIGFATNADFDPDANLVNARAVGNIVDDSGQRLEYDDGLLEIDLDTWRQAEG